MVNKVRTIDFLPEIFRTSTNRQFLNASLDVLTSQPDLKRVQGFIGGKYGYGVEPNDKYVVEPTKVRRDYQLDPGVIFLKPDTQTAKDFITYPGMIDALEINGAITNDHQRLWQNQFYSWDPFVDYDKVVNYTEYFWIPQGPDSVPVTTNIVYDSSEYTVTQDDNGYQYSQVSGINPVFSVLRGGTYTFEIPSGSSEFWLQTLPGVGATTTQRTIPGVTNNGTDNGTVTFVVPLSGTFPGNVIYYQSGSDALSVGTIQLIDANVDNYIDVNQIIGKKTYTSPNGVTFTNGLKVQFQGTVIPSQYQTGEYYVEGVGTSIQLLPVSNFITPEQGTEALYNPWDINPWDSDTWSDQLYVPVSPEYVTITRNSRDLNAWSRANRWFHQDVINTTSEFLGTVTSATNNTVTRAQRPIVEFRGNLKLFNSGIQFLGSVDIFDTITTDAFTDVQGRTLAQIGLIDGQNLFSGSKIVFSSDTDPTVRDKVYIVTLVESSTPGELVVALVQDTDITVINDSQVVVIYGSSNAGTTWRYDLPTTTWIQCQRKTEINQAPLYDIFDINGNSLSDNAVYTGTNFAGSKLFSYAVGTGQDDPVLGFPLSYSTTSVIGDIQFNVNLNQDVFSYATAGQDYITENINIGFVHYYPINTEYENLTGYIPAAGPSFQYQVFEFPITENLSYSKNNVTIIIETVGTGYSVGDRLLISGDQLGGTSPTNDLYVMVNSVGVNGQLLAIDIDTISGVCVDTDIKVTGGIFTAVTGNGSSASATIIVYGNGVSTFKCDIPASASTPWNSIVVYSNDDVLDQDQFLYVVNPDNTTTVTVPGVVGTKTTVLIISDYVSNTAYYQIPSNLENNPFNDNVTTIAVGDIRNQYRTIFTNAPGVTGQLYGVNNLHDLGNLNQYGTAIIQSSASLVLPGVFLRNQQVNLFNALQYNSEQYMNYKSLLIDLAVANDYSVYQTPGAILDDIIYTITTTKKDTTAFFWSDMLFSGNPYVSNTYTFNAPVSTATFALNPDAWSSTMFSQANYYGLAVYLTKTVNSRSITTQLLHTVDYVVSTDPALPSVIVTYDILAGDTITVKQYNQTYGSYCPNTPTKLGLYPSFVPAVVLDTTYTEPTYFIKGHDGSYNKLYGNYDVLTDTLDDFRDSVLLEFEKRVYNNLKVTGVIPLQYDNVVPGQFRDTEYTRSEVLSIYSTSFLNWVGANRLDYKTQVYRDTNKYTYNYNQSTNKLTNQALLQGYWRGIYNWFYDTNNPDTAPWEMLGLTDKPSWWESHYGPMPYTSGNTYMWQDIADGLVWNNGNPYIVPERVRPELLSVLPVDSSGNLISPFYSVMSNYSRLTFNRDWIVGDGAPVEASYLKSSTWPFDLMRLLALTKPAKFFNLFSDRDLYKYNSDLDQYLYNGRYHLDARTIQVYGNGTPKHSYIDWIVDYINQSGADGTETVTSLLKNLDVRLVYRMAGFTAKNYLKFLIEKATPNSKNTSLLIPDENYSILLYDNPPEETITYSSVILQKVAEGFKIYGNSKNKQYFTTVVGRPGYYSTVTVGNSTVQVSKEFLNNKTVTVPYGTIFYSMQAVSEFLQNYGRYLELQGVQFQNIIEGTNYNWIRMIQEFLFWAQQGWQVGSVISLNPNARTFIVNREGLIVQPLTLQNQNFLLNQNLVPIQAQDAAVIRDQETFTVKILNDGDTIAYSNLNLSSIEHSIVFDNNTVFNDMIYNLVTGLRQPRLLLQGYKSGEWNGYVDASGFILNENNVREWEPNVKYPKNKIVTYKSKYWTALKLIEPAAEFSNEDWLETEYGDVKAGLLPNPSTSAYEAQYFYDTTRANLENDVDLLAFSLIGFRPRDYLTAADLSDITQINVFKNIVKTKGTKLLADSFKGAEFDQGQIDYTIQENWAIKSGEFGSVLNRNFIEARLNQYDLRGNPAVIGFGQSSQVVPGVQQTIDISTLINYGRRPLTAAFLPEYQDSYTIERGLPSAGYVNLNDSKFNEYKFVDLNDNSTNIENIYNGDIIWIANYENSWGVFQANGLNNQLVRADNNLNDTVTLTFARPHGLVAKDLIAVTNFDYRINGFYVVKSVKNINSIVVATTLDPTINRITNIGTGFKLVPRRYTQPSDAYDSTLPGTQWMTRKIWADYDTDNQWAVYGASPVYRQRKFYTGSSSFATSLGYSTEMGQIVANGAGSILRYFGNGSVETVAGGVGTDTKLVAFDNYIYCSSPSQNRVYVYQYNGTSLSLAQTINPTAYISSVTGAIAVGKDRQWLYIADKTNQEIAIYAYNLSTGLYVYVDTLVDSVAPGSNWGHSIATSIDGTKLVVGAPTEVVSGNTDAGAAYVYTRDVERFYGNGVTTVFTLENAAPSNIAFVYQNDVIASPSPVIASTTVTFATAPAAGTIITVSTGYMSRVQRFTKAIPAANTQFGFSVDTNRYGAEVIVGSPYEINTVNGVSGVEGAVYRYTNSGQRYGVITGTVTTPQTGTIFIDGFIVNYSGTIDQIVDDINTQTPTNIIASYSGTTLTITVKDNTPEVINNIIDITGAIADLTNIGITSYTGTQVIYNTIDTTNVSAYGYNVKMNERDSLLIAATTSSRFSPTTFDYTENCNQDDTIIDGGATTFIDSFANIGTVYEYGYLPAANEDIANPGKYAFGQYISTADISVSSPSPRFGYSLAYADGVILAGTPYWSSTLGGFVAYDTAWVPQYTCEVNQPTSWHVDKKPLTIVDVNSVNNVSLYDTSNNQTLEYLDYIDPGLGKLLGAVETNIDFLSSADPAAYDNNGVSWTSNHVGQTWLDLNTIRLLNYHQPSIDYNAKNWGKAFPGSTATVYTWISSTVPPIEYSGPGFPYDYNSYTSSTGVDGSTNSLITTFYFWVQNFNDVPAGKTLSPITISTYLLNPLNSGIAYLAPITTNIVSLYNSGAYIQSNTSALHMGYGIPGSLDETHTSWSLIRQDNPEDFLSGLPNPNLGNATGNQPGGLYLKFIESFSGFDSSTDANQVPDPALPELLKYGTAFRPRQSMFVDRLLALNNYLTYANNILIKLPITESRDFGYLNMPGVSAYWSYVDWWAQGYSSSTKPVMEVNTVSELQTIVSGELLVASGVNIFLEDGLVVKVRTNNVGKAEYYVYESSTGWRRIGLENGTIQFLPKLWNNTNGWSSDGWSTSWDNTPAQQIVWIIRWLNEKCYINELDIERNKSLVLMFNYIQSESLQQQNYLPWLNKTSLIDVKHKIRELLPYKKFQRDNQEFLEGFLNEIKPYHVLIKDFVFTYTGQDIYLGNITDFDLPAQYNSLTGKFDTPQLVYNNTSTENQYTADSVIWEEPIYTQWFNNYGVTISNVEVNVYPTTTLASAMAPSDTVAYVQSVFGLPSNGAITIGSEYMYYNSVNYVQNTIVGLTRGVNDTVAAVHDAGTVVNVVLPAVALLTGGRGYTEPPTVTVYVDTSVYPAPRTPAVLEPIMAGDVVLGINVVDPGSGYVTKPEIVISGSSIAETFGSTNVNTVLNTVTIASHQFVDGDCVYYTYNGATTPPTGLNENTYYYVGVIDINTIALYNSYTDAVAYGTGSPVSQIAADDGRVALITAGSGTGNSLNVTARAICFDTQQPVRENKVTLRFDRTTYNTTVTDWEPGVTYLADESLVIYNNRLYRCVITNTDPIYEIQTISRTSNIVTVITTTPHLLSSGDYVAINDTVGFNGNFGPVTVVNGTTFTYGQSGINSSETVGIIWKPTVIDPAEVYRPFDINSIVRTSNVVTVSTNLPNYLSTGDYIVVEETSTFDGVFGPITVLNSTTFTYSQIASNASEAIGLISQTSTWKRVSSDDPSLSAADRIWAYYTPTSSMPGKVLPLLMTGVEYPGAVFLGESFVEGVDPSTETTLESPGFTEMPPPTTYTVDGGEFELGYGPEELIPGVISDTLTMNITTTGGSPLSFRMFVGNDGVQQVYNSNPYTETALTQDFISDNTLYYNVMHVADASALISSPTQEFGYIYVNGEYIRWEIIDLMANTISGLSRGIAGTITNTIIESGATVQTVLPRDLLSEIYMDQWWYGPPGDPSANTTLQSNTYPAAIFLQNLVP